MEMWKLITVNTEHKQDYQYSISLKIHIVVDIRGICRRTYLSTQSNNIFYAKRNSAHKVAFDMPSNVGPTYGMYVGPTSYQRYTSNMCYVGATLRQHVGPTMAQRANLRWANVVCQRWANGVANQNTPLVQRYHAIWVQQSIFVYFLIWSADYPFSHFNCQEQPRRARPEYYALIHLMCIVWSLSIIISRLFHSQNGLRSLIMALPEGLCIVFWLIGYFLNDTC